MPSKKEKKEENCDLFYIYCEKALPAGIYLKKKLVLREERDSSLFLSSSFETL